MCAPLFFHSKAFQPGSSRPLQVPLERSSSQLAEALRRLEASQAGSRVTDLFLINAQLWWRASNCKLIHHLKQHYSSCCPNRACESEILCLWWVYKHGRVLSGRQAFYLMTCWAVKRDMVRSFLMDICQYIYIYICYIYVIFCFQPGSW